MRHLFTFILILLGQLGLNAQFQDFSSQIGPPISNPNVTDGNGASFADFDLDGWDDISVVRNGLSPMFFKNDQGTLYLYDLNIEGISNVNQRTVLWADYDNDGDRDLLITQSGHPVRLFRNDGNIQNMVDVANEVGIIAQDVSNLGASWVDYDRDGWLDLFICKYHNPSLVQGYEYANHLYRNQGDGTFEDVTLMSGLGFQIEATYQSTFLDYNNDMWPDLHIINDRIQFPNVLYENNGDGTFTDVSAQSGANIYIDSMCSNAADYDHDGDLDLFITHTGPDVLQVNNGDGTFTNVQEIAGVDSPEHGWGSAWIDYQNDSWQDLFVANQDNDPTSIILQNSFYLNQGDGTFIHYEPEVGLGNDVHASFSVAKADFDHDGWEDFFSHNGDESDSKLWKNQTHLNSNNNWLQISLEGTFSNKDAVGSWIEVHLPNDLLVEFTTCGENFLSQNSFTKHFGLGTLEQVDSVVIKWPSGLIESYLNVPSNQLVHYVEGASLSAPLNTSGQEFICFGDSLLLSVPGYSNIQWSNGLIADSIYVDGSGLYFATVTNTEGFSFNSDTLILNTIPAIELQTTTSDAFCFGSSDGTAELEITGGQPPYEIDWLGNNPDSLSAGTFEVLVLDEFGCTNQIEYQIEQPEELTLLSENTQTINDDCEASEYNSGTVSISGGTEPYNTTWTFNSPEFTDPIIIEGELYDCIPNVEGLTYELSITDANGCSINDQGELDFFVGIQNQNLIETKVYPNPVKNLLYIRGIRFTHFKIYNAQGQLLLSRHLMNSETINSIEVDQLSPGVYSLELENSSESYFMRFIKE